MTIVATLLNKEKVRNHNMIKAYEKELDILPKGTIKAKTMGNNTYYYLNYRDGKKVISKYVGKDEETLDHIKEQLVRRNQIESMLKKLKEEQLQIQKLEMLL